MLHLFFLREKGSPLWVRDVYLSNCKFLIWKLLILSCIINYLITTYMKADSFHKKKQFLIFRLFDLAQELNEKEKVECLKMRTCVRCVTVQRRLHLFNMRQEDYMSWSCLSYRCLPKMCCFHIALEWDPIYPDLIWAFCILFSEL